MENDTDVDVKVDDCKMSIDRMKPTEDIPARCVTEFGAMEMLDLANGAQVLFISLCGYPNNLYKIE